MNNRFTLILVIAAFSAPYLIDVRIKFLITVPLLLLSLRLHYGPEWRKQSGLFGSQRALVAGALLTATLFTLVRMGLSSATHHSDIQVTWSNDLIKYLAPFSQVLGEEIILRAVLLRSLGNRVRSPALTAIGTAVFFSATHAVVYANLDYLGGVALTPLCLFNLFLFGLIGNALFLANQNIVFPYALHLGWNLARFTGAYIVSERALSEAESFNQIEGSWPVTALLVLIGVGLLVAFQYSRAGNQTSRA